MGDRHAKLKKLWFIVLIACSLIILFFQGFYSRSISLHFSEHIQLQRNNSISKLVQLSYNTIKPVVDKVKSGELDKTQARKMVSDIVRAMAYEDEFGSNYIFMSTYEGIMMVQPFEPRREGTNQWDLKDAKGNYIIRELVKAAQEKPSGSFVSYYYYLPDKSEVQEKLSYVIGIPEIDAYIGTGMYMESSYIELRKILEHQRNGYIGLTLFILFTLMLYFRALIKGNNMLRKEIHDREKAEEELKLRYGELQDAQKELQQNHDELSAIYEELTATEEELRAQYDELQKSQEEVSILAERYMLVSEGSLSAIWDWDAKNKKLFVSERLREILGYSKEELNISRFMDIYKLIHPEDREKAYDDHKEHKGSKTDYFSSEYRLKCKNGAYKWFNLKGRSVFDTNGQMIRHAGSITDITERKTYEEEIRQLAYFDYLTGLPNRMFITHELKDKLSKCGVDSCGGSVFFIDMDNFKYINDTFGHSYGDRVLVEVSNRLKSLYQDGLVISRIGGDEFIIIQDAYRKEEEVGYLAQRVLDLFKDPVSVGRNNFYIACSIGIALYPMNGSTTEEVLKNADMAMYKAKNMGKNRYVFYDYNMGIDMSERIETEKQLRSAFENDEFELFYQPHYDIEREIIVGFEALIRWNSPVYGLVMPSQFIGLAEEVGLIGKIGKWVIDKSFKFAGTLLEKGICVSCNVSSIQLVQSNFVDDVIEAFDRYGLKKGNVAIEITESSLIESFKETTEKLKRLRDKGILIYLDDFGTGYSSLTYLRKLPIDVVKIDKSFVDGIISGGVETRIIKTIISLVHEIGMEVVAEGVETVEQLEYLTECNCNYIQGYLISKPVYESEAVKFV